MAWMLKKQFENMGLSVAVLKLAQPLYEIQSNFYEQSLVNVAKEKQNQRLLEIIATEMRSIDPASLVNNFQQRLNLLDTDIVINDDLRDDQIDWPHLKHQQFLVIRVLASREKRRCNLSARGDLSVVADSRLNQQISKIRASFVLINNTSLDDLEFQVRSLIDHLLSSKTPSNQRGQHATA